MQIRFPWVIFLIDDDLNHAIPQIHNHLLYNSSHYWQTAMTFYGPMEIPQEELSLEFPVSNSANKRNANSCKKNL